MTPQEFQKFYPLIAQWLRETLAAHARSARAVASCGFLAPAPLLQGRDAEFGKSRRA